MIEENNILNWWNSLDKNWQEIFEVQIQINTLFLKLKLDLNKQLDEKEKKLTELKENFADNHLDLKILSITNLFKGNRIIVGKKTKFILENLNPLLPIIGLTEITFNNCEIRDLSVLDELKKIEKLKFTNVIIKSNIPTLLNTQNNYEIYFDKCTISKQPK
jgi:hypothetical protein